MISYDVIGDVHGHDLAVEAGQVVGIAVMQFADGFHAMPGLLQAMRPAAHLTVVGNGIVPTAGLVYMAASCDCGACRYANW